MMITEPISWIVITLSPGKPLTVTRVIAIIRRESASWLSIVSISLPNTPRILPSGWVSNRHRTVEHVLKCFAEQIVRRQIRQHAHGRTHSEGKECLRKTKHRVDAFVNSVSSSKLFFLPVGQPNAIKGQAGQRDVAGAHVDMTCEPCLHEESVIS